MPFVPAPNCVQVEVRWTLDSQQCENRFFVQAPGPVVPATLNAIAAVVDPWTNTAYVDIVPDVVFFTENIYTDWSEDGGVQLSSPTGTPGNGTAGSLPNECSFCISLRTGLRGRSNRGRWFTPPPTNADRVLPNRVTSAYVTAAQNRLQTLIHNLDTAGFPMGVVSFVHNKVPRAAGVFNRYIAAQAVNDILDSQRRRRPGNGQ